ncbi:MAG TPA: sigma factor-like helix-turn-helix DNA-binding protein [Polyangiaceae bacterium]|nr:sigma factor-like helix-turn-helix DNA-binding protein [Polyangiaceae bacterium]
MGTVDLIGEPARFGTLLGEAVQWCDRITLCLAAPRSEQGTAQPWSELLAASTKYDRIFVSEIPATESWLLHRLHETGALRLIRASEPRYQDQLLCFERAGSVQLFLARAPLTGATLHAGCGAVVHFRGESTDEFASSFQRLIDQWREAARAPTGSELDALTAPLQHPAPPQPSPPVTATPFTPVTDRRALREAISELFALDLGAPPAEGVTLWAREADPWRLSLTALSDGVRLELTAAQGTVEIVLRAEDSTLASTGLLLRDSEGHLALAWRGGLLGSSEKKNQTLWSQCRLTLVEVAALGSDGAAERAERVALIAQAGSELAPQLAAFAEEVRRLRELLAPRQRQTAGPGYADFATLDGAEQGALVWQYLIGLGPLPLDEAVGISAQGLREDGYVRYERLRRDGPLYELLSQRLLREASEGARFDRPARGQVRAIQPELESFAREDWLDCLANALPEGEVLDRAAAMRLVFQYARETWGLGAQRLRSGGKSEKALKSALNSAIRRGLLQRVGAAYVQKVSANAPAAVEPVEPVEPTNSSTSPAAQNVPDVQGDPLARRLFDLPLPTRTVTWAQRQGLTTVRDLAAWHPDAFAAEPNLGRLTSSETRLALETALGREWEEVWSELDEPKTPPPHADEAEPDDAAGPLPGPDHSRWNRRGEQLSEPQQRLPLTRLELPTRMRAFCDQRGFQTLGELLAVPRDELLAQPNLGRASLLQTLAAVDQALYQLEHPDQIDQLVSGWRQLVQRLPPLQRMILARRSGSYGPRETLESLGETLGLTRERVRQIEASCLEDLRQRSALVEALQQRLTQAFAGGRCVPLNLLLQNDPWWQGIEPLPDWTDYLFERLLGGSVHRLRLPQQDQQTTFFARFTQHDLELAQKELLAQAAQIPTPAHFADYEPLLERAVQKLDPALREALQIVLEEQLNLDEDDPERVLSFGNTKPDRVLALLASQPQPIPVSAVFEALGRCKLPDEVLYFRRGVVGLEQHFPDFRLWLDRLVPACRELMAELPAGRQWLVTELHEALREAGKLPDWLGHWHLASLLRRSGQVDYLGRLRVALPSEGNRQERIHHSDAVLQVLQAAGTPLPLESIAEQVRRQTDIRDSTLGLLLLSSPFVKLADNLYGLIERDVPGGSQAIARAVEAVLERLEAGQRGLTAHQARHVAADAVGETWSPELVLSLLRSEPQLRLSRSGHVGLVSWDDVRAPTRGEFIRQLVEKTGGRLGVAELQSKLLDTYGRELERAELGGECQRNGLQLEAEVIVVRAPAQEETPPASITSPFAPNLVRLDAGLSAPADPLPDLAGRVQGLPAAARQHFEELLLRPLQSREQLLEQAKAHLAEIEAASHQNEFIDVSLAQALVERMARLLEQVEALSPVTRRIAQAAVLYFISPEDAEDDFDLGGLEDDEAVLSAVLAHLELS